MHCYGSFSYSLDKIKLKGKLLKPRKNQPYLSSIQNWCFYKLPQNIECRETTEGVFAAFKYRYSYTLFLKGEKEGAFHVREHYNGDYKEQKQIPEQFLIEFNPNKKGFDIWREFCRKFLFYITEIIQFDIAYDIPNATANDVLLNTICDVMTYGKTTERTLYISPKEEYSGRIKIYTKSKEREAHGENMEDTLRIEATIKCKTFNFNTIHVYGDTQKQLEKVVNRINSVYIKRSSAESKDWKIYALSHLSVEELQKCLSLMYPKVKAKYRKIICEENYYTLNLDITTLVIHVQTLLSPFLEFFKVIDRYSKPYYNGGTV